MVLIDTNVLVYAHDSAELVRRPIAREMLGVLTPEAGVLSAQCLSEFFSVMTRSNRGLPPRMTPAEAIEQVALLAESFGVLDLGSAVVLEAGRGVRDHGLSFYDAQIWAIAKLNQIPVVFTEDFQDGMSLEGVRFVNPFAQGFDLGRWI